MKRLCISLAVLLVCCMPAAGQIYSPGANPSNVMWSSISTEAYEIIYPRGMDSLARAYAVSLEKYRGLEAAGCGFAPNEKYNKRFPVVLHPFSVYSNGLVSWAPRAMHLYTVPESLNPESTPWIDQLAVHESRHVAQIQLGKAMSRTMNYLMGELWPGLVSGMYPGPALLEGDAVVAETALGKGGRGRTADFLEYYRVCFADSLYRDWYQWRWGSQKRYTPDYYRAGYVLNSGMRAFYGDNFFAHYTRRILKRGLPLSNLKRTVEEASGKTFHTTFNEIQKNLTGIWAADEERRGPFIDGESVTSPARLYDSYTSLVFADDELLALHAGLSNNRELVMLDYNGKPWHMNWFSQSTSRLAYSPTLEALLWTESKPDSRWENKSTSVLKSRNGWGMVRTIAAGAKYYNPAPDPVSQDVALVQYYDNGAASVVVLDGKTGKKLLEYPAPEDVQPVEPVWTKDGLFVSGINGDGYTIYRINSVDGAFSSRLGWSLLFPADHAKINRLFGRDGLIWFSSDMNGVNNLYSVDPADGTILQRTSTRFGGNEFAFAPDGDLYYSAPTVKSREIRRIAADSLLAIPVQFHTPCHPVAEALSAMEPAQPDPDLTTSISEPRNYSKFRLPRIHSWAPLYVDLDIASTLTYEETVYTGATGATAFFQNDLGTTWGSVGVSLSSLDTLKTNDYEFRPSFHAQLVFSGLPMKLELRADVNERDAHHYRIPFQKTSSSLTIGTPYMVCLDEPYYRLSACGYLPFDLSSGGWSKGAVLSFKGMVTNDMADALGVMLGSFAHGDGRVSFFEMAATAYSVLPTLPSCIYPKLGIGGKLGYVTPGGIRVSYPLHDYSEHWTGKVYAYLPGLLDTHGFKLSAEYTGVMGSHWVNADHLEINANYAFPFAPVDWSFLGPVAYIRNFEGILHADYNTSRMQLINKPATGPDRETVSRSRIGATVQVRLSNFLWAPADVRIGVRRMYDITSPEDSFTEMVLSTDLF